MAMNQVSKLLLLLPIFFLALLSSCSTSPLFEGKLPDSIPVTEQVGLNQTSTSTVQPTVAISSTSTPIIIPTQKITQPICKTSEYRSQEFEVTKIWWPADNEALLFQTQSGETGEFDFLQNEASLDETISAPSEGIPNWIRQRVPPSIEDQKIHVSPSGMRVVYEVPIYTQPTPTPQTIGEPSGMPELIADLYWFEEGNPTPILLGRTEGGLLYFYWSHDENMLLIGSGFPEVVHVTIWLVDFQEGMVNPLPIQQDPDYKKNPFPIGFSPDNSIILFGMRGEPWQKDLQTGEERVLSIPPFYYHWWISEDEFLVLLDEGAPFEDQFALFVYNLRSDQLFLVSETFIQPKKYFPDPVVVLSPDHLKLGYIDEELRLNVLTLCKEMLSNR